MSVMPGPAQELLFAGNRHDALEYMYLKDRNFGWTIEMRVRGAKCSIVSIERSVGYRQRIGISKISGILSGFVGAETKILFIIPRGIW
jgi:hypothetical protein